MAATASSGKTGTPFERRKKASFADLPILEGLKAAAVVNESSDELHYRGWQFKVSHSKICSSAQLKQLAKSIEAKLVSPRESHASQSLLSGSHDHDDDISVDGHKLHMPPMLFLDDVVSIKPKHEHEHKQVGINWNAADSLFTWAQTHSNSYTEKRPLRIVQVPYAKAWHQKNVGIVSTTVTTTTTDNSTVAATNVPHAVSTVNTAPLPVRKWDWTFSSDYMCSLQSSQPSSSSSAAAEENRESLVVSAALLSEATKAIDIATDTDNVSIASEGSEWHWERVDKNGIDFEMLKSTDEPILFFDEATLYQDDLEDCGEITTDIKLRVMPKCWFVLNRMLLRVDGSIVRVREVRFFHCFDRDSNLSPTEAEATTAVRNPSLQIHVAVTWRELNLLPDIDALPIHTNHNLTNHSSSHPTTSSLSIPAPPTVLSSPFSLHATAAPGAIAAGAGLGPSSNWGVLRPQELRNPQWVAERVPEVNRREDIHQFFTLYLHSGSH